MLTVALFTVAKIWTQIKCPLRDEWINKVWYVEYSLQFSSVAQRVMYDSLRPHESQHARPSCLSPG